MANPTCTRASLVEASPCLAGTSLSLHQQQAVRLWFMILELQALGGTDYRSTLQSTLMQDAVTLADTMNPSQRRTALMTIYRNNAVAAGASPSSDPSALLASVACFTNFPDLDQIELLLLCKLGTHKSYPQ